MKKRELQAGIIAGMLWLWWIIFMLDPQMLRFCVQNIDMMITPLRLELIGPPAATVILVLGLLMNRKTIVGSGCLAIIGFDVLWLFRTKPFALVFTGTRGLLTIAHLAEALAFLMLLTIHSLMSCIQHRNRASSIWLTAALTRIWMCRCLKRAPGASDRISAMPRCSAWTDAA